METIRVYIEEFINWCGVEQSYLYVGSHVLLVTAVLLLSWLVYMLCVKLVMPMITKLTAKTRVTWDDIVFNQHSQRAFFRLIPAMMSWQLLPIVFYRHSDIQELVRRLTLLVVVVVATRFALSLVNSLRRFENSQHPTLHQYFNTFCGVLKVIVIFIAVIIVIAVAIDRSPLTLIAGLGATSAILMLVFKDVITGLVAGVRLTSNNMLHKGDWITVPKSGVDGIVEDITLTTVKVRNFDKTILTITPQTLVEQSFQNWRGMKQSDGRRVKRIVYFDFRSITTVTPELRKQIMAKKYFKADEIKVGEVNMSLYRRYVEKFLKNSPEVNTDMLYVVRQREATNTGLPLEFYFFLREKEWKPYEQQMAEILERIYALAPDFGLRIFQLNYDVRNAID